MNRYRLALAMGRDEYEAAIQEDTMLLDHFGLQLLSVEHGLRAAVKAEIKKGKVNPWNVLSIDEKTWKWLRPLLLQLREQGSTSLPLAAK